MQYYQCGLVSLSIFPGWLPLQFRARPSCMGHSRFDRRRRLCGGPLAAAAGL